MRPGSPVLAQSRRAPASDVDLAFYRLWRGTKGVIALECAFGGALDASVLASAVELLLDDQPIVGSRLVPEPHDPHWLPVRGSERAVLTVVDSGLEFERMRCVGVDAAAGPQIALVLWRRAQGDRLLLKVTHVLGDGVSLQLLAGRLASLYSSLAEDPDHRPNGGLADARDPRALLNEISRLRRLRAILDFAWFMAPRLLPRPTHRLAVPDGPAGPRVAVVRRLAAPSLSAVARYGKERGATVNDVFLTAAYRALAAEGWDGTSALRIPITVDVRRWCLAPDRRETIGNVSAFEYPFLIRRLGGSFDETLARVVTLTQRRKKSGPGLAIGLISLRMSARRLAKGAVRPEAGSDVRRRRGRVLLTFSNEGLLDKSSLRFGAEAPSEACILPPFVVLPTLHVCLSGYDGALTLAAITSENGEAHVARFLDALLHELPLELGLVTA